MHIRVDIMQQLFDFEIKRRDKHLIGESTWWCCNTGGKRKHVNPVNAKNLENKRNPRKTKSHDLAKSATWSPCRRPGQNRSCGNRSSHSKRGLSDRKSRLKSRKTHLGMLRRSERLSPPVNQISSSFSTPSKNWTPTSSSPADIVITCTAHQQTTRHRRNVRLKYSRIRARVARDLPANECEDARTRIERRRRSAQLGHLRK